MVKGPKLMNPADKARKEARKKELKKNKKQRQQVRSAVIESKDPEQVISELEKLDRFEFDVVTNPTLSDSFCKDKRKRLLDSWSKILTYYEKEDPERHAKLKKLNTEYEVKHKKLAKDFEAIKAAQELKIEDVFLPPEPKESEFEIADDDPLLSESVYITPLSEGMKPPGCPPGLPPDLRELVENLRTSLVAQVAQEAQPLPLNLINLGLPQNVITDSATKNQSSAYQRPKGDPDQWSRYSKNQSEYNRADITAKTTKQNPAKRAVIESQPVIFKPKATKFVPSSVRSKLVQQEK